MNIRKCFLISLIFISHSCSTAYKNEHQHYLGIKSALAKDRYSLAVVEIMDFKKLYPRSAYLCELLSIEIAWKRDREMDTSNDELVVKEKCTK